MVGCVGGAGQSLVVGFEAQACVVGDQQFRWIPILLMTDATPPFLLCAGALYIGSRGIGFLFASLAHAFPQLGALLASIQRLLGFKQ